MADPEARSVMGGRTIAPMKAAVGEIPVDDWIVELKWDGMRIVSFIDEGRVRLQSTNLRDVTASFPELDRLAQELAPFGPMILDGEIVAFGDDGLPSFRLLQNRMHIEDRAEAARRSQEVPISYVIFDLLHLNGQDVMGLGWDDRRQLLDQVVDAPGPWWMASSVHDAADASSVLDAVIERGMEGVVAKKRGSRYEPGRRSPAWRKVKPRLRHEFVVGGWASGQGNRSDTIGSLLVGYYEGGALRFAGRVGSGLTSEDLAAWQQRLAPLERPTSPFASTAPPAPGRHYTWVEPQFVVEVAFAEWGDGADQYLRHPSYLGWRHDKAPVDVVREP